MNNISYRYFVVSIETLENQKFTCAVILTHDEIYTSESFINWWGELIGIGGIEEHEGLWALCPQFWRTRTATAWPVDPQHWANGKDSKFDLEDTSRQRTKDNNTDKT